MFLAKAIRSGLNHAGNYPKTSCNNYYLFLYKNLNSFFWKQVEQYLVLQGTFQRLSYKNKPDF